MLLCVTSFDHAGRRAAKLYKRTKRVDAGLEHAWHGRHKLNDPPRRARHHCLFIIHASGAYLVSHSMNVNSTSRIVQHHLPRFEATQPHFCVQVLALYGRLYYIRRNATLMHSNRVLILDLAPSEQTNAALHGKRGSHRTFSHHLPGIPRGASITGS